MPARSPLISLLWRPAARAFAVHAQPHDADRRAVLRFDHVDVDGLDAASSMAPSLHPLDDALPLGEDGFHLGDSLLQLLDLCLQVAARRRRRLLLAQCFLAHVGDLLACRLRYPEFCEEG
jgi:hypothetical protein